MIYSRFPQLMDAALSIAESHVVQITSPFPLGRRILSGADIACSSRPLNKAFQVPPSSPNCLTIAMRFQKANQIWSLSHRIQVLVASAQAISAFAGGAT